MHAGTPTADGAHVILCSAMSLVMTARTFADALGLKRTMTSEKKLDKAVVALSILYAFSATYFALSTGRSLEMAPGTMKHLLYVTVPTQALLVGAMRARGSFDGSSALCALCSLCCAGASVVAPSLAGRKIVSTLGLGVGFIAARLGARGGGVLVLMSACWYVTTRLVVRSVEEVHFANWFGSIAAEIVPLVGVKFEFPALTISASARRDHARRVLAAARKKSQ
jgi:hypothetical protein